MLCYTLVIAFLFGLWATAKSEDNVKGQNLPTPKKAEDTAANIIVDPTNSLERRVLLSSVFPGSHPPTSPSHPDRSDPLHKDIRARRAVNPVQEEGEHTLCDSVSFWDGDKTTAMDMKNEEVKVVQSIPIGDKNYKQYFFVTKCRDAKPKSRQCRGIDDRYWNSYCDTKNSFVKALTEKNGLTSWRYIRIDTACVCVITKKNGMADETMTAESEPSTQYSIPELPEDAVPA